MLFREMDNKTKGLIIQAIRRSFTMSDTYAQVKKLARVEKPRYKLNGELSKVPDVRYRCACCNVLFKDKEVQVDHKSPVVSISSATKQMTVKQYYNKVHCSITNLQVVSIVCHKQKTNIENSKRVKLDRKGNNLKPKYKKKAIKRKANPLKPKKK